MNIYFCHYKNEPTAGLFVVAPTRGIAKKLFYQDVDDFYDYTDVRSQIIKRGVCSDWPHVINQGDADLERYGLEYEGEP